MPKQIGDEVWLNQAEAAQYIHRSISLLRDALRRYKEQTGEDIEKVRDGNEVLVRQSDMDALIIRLYPFLARQKGLIT